MRKFAIKSVIVVHFVWLAAVIASLPLAFIYPSYHRGLLVFIGFTLLAQIPLGTCPFTYVENKLRMEAAYNGMFMTYYLKRIFGINASERQVRYVQAAYFVAIILVAIFYKMPEAF